MAWELIVIALATYRFSRMVAYEHGPFAIFETIREWCGCRYDELPDEDGNPRYVTPRPGSLAEAISCPKCLSIWFSLVFFFLPTIFSVPFAISAVTVVLVNLER